MLDLTTPLQNTSQPTLPCLNLGICLGGWLQLKVPFQKEANIPKCPFPLIPGSEGAQAHSSYWKIY